MFDTNTKQTLFVIIALVVVLVLFSTGDFVGLFRNEGIVLDFDTPVDFRVGESSEHLFSGGVMVRDEVLGDGVEANIGSVVMINYVGYLEDGTVFDDFFEEQMTVEFEVGSGKIITGVEAGILGMKVGGKRSIYVTPEYGYGANEFGEIPANSNVIFDVVLVGVQS